MTPVPQTKWPEMHSSVSSSCTIFRIVLTFILTLVHSITLQSDVEAFQSLKSSIDPSTIPPSSYLSIWDFSVDPCESTGARFLGILCCIPLDNSTSRIISLELDDAGYEGFLTPNIGNVTELTSFDFNRNNLEGHYLIL